ncbi:unnamed protein product [Rotaria socialis]|uniref:PI3K/PI4K catalytic domain-containing protein n=1 Tax=Rotaria socialis TaxID=392032 RepID=A0A818TBI2_9BILA|nr:unnamed protein product [Rotaria socialis]
MHFYLRADVLKDEFQRLESMTHLTKEEKEFLIKEKQDVLFKSFITFLEAVSQITRASAETPREQTFEKDYSKQIDAAIEQLKQPITLSNPHSCATPLFTLYKRWQQRQATALTWKAQNDNQEIALTTVPKPNDDKQPVEDRREVPMPILRQCIEELIRETPADLLSRELWCSCPSVGLWYKNVQNYSRSLAVTSMIGYMIGLGDRHLDNVLVDLKSGQIIHIDYNICFEKGKKLRVPEKVPYRLTQNLQNALGIAELEGVFHYHHKMFLKYYEAHIDLKSNIFYDKLYDFVENDNVLISTSPVVLAADFLQTACKTTLLHQSEQLDDELRNTLKVYRTARQQTVTNILKNLVDLCQYLPIDYIESSLLTKLKDRLSELCNNFTTEKFFSHAYFNLLK